jgi:hypothetical protein
MTIPFGIVFVGGDGLMQDEDILVCFYRMIFTVRIDDFVREIFT